MLSSSLDDSLGRRRRMEGDRVGPGDDHGRLDRTLLTVREECVRRQAAPQKKTRTTSKRDNEITARGSFSAALRRASGRGGPRPETKAA